MKYLIVLISFVLLSFQNIAQVTISEKKSINSFFDFPLESIRIESGKKSCFDSNANLIIFSKRDNDSLKVSFRMSSEKSSNTIAIKDATDLLESIFINKNDFSKIKDFEITESDIQSYLYFVDSLDVSEKNKEVFRAFSNQFNKMDSLTLKRALKMNKTKAVPTTSYGFTVIFKNQKGDKVMANSRYYDRQSLMFLPWDISYNDEEFESYDISLTNFADENTPTIFGDKTSSINQKCVFMCRLALYCKHMNIDF